MNARTAETGAATDDLEGQIHQAVVQREQVPRPFPDADAVEAMEEPLHRLIGATVLFTDLASVSGNGPALSTVGLSFLAESMNREAVRLFRLYHGHPPRSP
jgi:hypothetical protein